MLMDDIARNPDRSNGYEAIAEQYVASRSPVVGVSTVRRWLKTLKPKGTIVDVACGHGVPLGQLVVEEGFSLYALDASPTLARSFQVRFPKVPLQVSPAEESDFFGREFDGVIAWGLLFLLQPETQIALLRRLSAVLDSSGKLLFTAPEEATTWNDSLTGRPSISLGKQEYERILRECGLRLEGEDWDEGENHYYLAARSK